MLTIRKWSPGGSFETGAGAAARAVALGIFDGVHLGHRAVISKATGVETPEGMLRAAVFTFSQSPWALPKDSAWELLSPAQKIKALESLGVEEMLLADFEQIRDMSPAAFVAEVLDASLHAKRVCCGFNYRFGKNGAGDAALLARLCGERGIEAVTVPPVEVLLFH